MPRKIKELDTVLEISLKHLGGGIYDKEYFFQRTNKHHITLYRQLIFTIAYRTTKHSYATVGAYYSPKKPYDHATVIHGTKTVDDIRFYDVGFCNLYYKIEKEVLQTLGKKQKTGYLQFKKDIFEILETNTTKTKAIKELRSYLREYKSK